MDLRRFAARSSNDLTFLFSMHRYGAPVNEPLVRTAPRSRALCACRVRTTFPCAKGSAGDLLRALLRCILLLHRAFGQQGIVTDDAKAARSICSALS